MFWILLSAFNSVDALFINREAHRFTLSSLTITDFCLGPVAIQVVN